MRKQWLVLGAALALWGPAAGAEQTPLPRDPDAPNRVLAIARSQKHFTRPELDRLLALTYAGPILCATGEVWPAFMGGAPHSRETVDHLLAMYREQRNLWKRAHLLSALSLERQPHLREFWLNLVQDPRLPPEHMLPVLTGLTGVGRDADLIALLPRLRDPKWTFNLLLALEQRPLPAAREAVLARFRDRREPAHIRTRALELLLQIHPSGASGYLREALTDGDPEVSEHARQLAKGMEEPPVPR